MFPIKQQSVYPANRLRAVIEQRTLSAVSYINGLNKQMLIISVKYLDECSQNFLSL